MHCWFGLPLPVLPRWSFAPLLSLFAAREATDWLYLPDYDDANTRRDAQMTCPSVDSALIRRYVQRFVIGGYLPRPGSVRDQPAQASRELRRGR